MLRGRNCELSAINEAAQQSKYEVYPITDIRSTRDYRSVVVPYIVNKVILGAIDSATQ